jgi:hypothetical protein
MKNTIKITKLFISVFFIVLLLKLNTSAQLISVKTIPIASGNQFFIFPSENMGMGGVSIALNDYLLDPFINPAKGSLKKGISVFSAPIYYTISQEDKSTQTFPLGFRFNSKSWFGSVLIAAQQLEFSNTSQKSPNVGFNLYPELGDNQSSNHYLYGSLGTHLSDYKTSIALGLLWADLKAVEGVDLLYANNDKVEQFGNLFDLRMGLYYKMQKGKILELILLHNRIDMTHDVISYYWQHIDIWGNYFGQTQFERHLDKTRTYGIHLGYKQPLSHDHWQFGTILTSNWKSHPKIPNYELMKIPRDPGNSYAFNLGIGLSKSTDLSTIGIDLIYEPIWSYTWADALGTVTTRTGDIINHGEKTVENDFKFSNVLLRAGFYTHEKPVEFQLGFQTHLIQYWLDQKNFVEEFQRKQKEKWTEWTITCGLIFKFDEMQIRYFGRLMAGTGRPGVISNDFRTIDFAGANSDFLIAPSGSLILEEEHILLHQLSVNIPISD